MLPSTASTRMGSGSACGGFSAPAPVRLAAAPSRSSRARLNLGGCQRWFPPCGRMPTAMAKNHPARIVAQLDVTAPLLRIEAPHFVAGVIVGERAAPIIAFMRTWTETRIRWYCARKGWTVS
jgi:hypothetical protein